MHPAVPLVLDSPHSGRELPADFDAAVSEAELREAEDCYVDELYAAASATRWSSGARASCGRSSAPPSCCSTCTRCTSPAPIMVCAKSEKSVALARRIGVPADLLLDTGHSAGLRMMERGAFSDPASPRTAILIECGQHWQKSSVEVAIDTSLRFLAVAGVAKEDSVRARLRLTPPAAQRSSA